MSPTSGALQGQVALVTGGASGIGRAVVLRYLAEGASVVVLDRDEAAGRALDDRRRRELLVVAGAADQPEPVAAAVAAAVDRFGGLDIVVANAGVHDHHRSLRSLSLQEVATGFDQLFSVNVKGVLLAAACARPHLREGGGSLIVTLSPASFQAGGGGPLYTASKHAALGLVRQLAYELAPHVRVNGVAPGATRTRLRGAAVLGDHGTDWEDQTALDAATSVTPLGFVADPEDHTGAYVLLASRREGRTLTAAVIRTDGGMGVPVRPRRRAPEGVGDVAAR